MPKGVYERKHSKTKRAHILAVASRIYAHYGFEGATIDKMAAEAGVSKALILDYFDSKQGLVKAIAADALARNLQAVRAVDEAGEHTLRQREALLHETIRAAREEWCLILGTLLVPNFDFPMRGELAHYLRANSHLVVRHHLHELRNPTAEAAYHYAYIATSLHFSYVLDPRDREFLPMLERQLSFHLRPEEEILAARGAS